MGCGSSLDFGRTMGDGGGRKQDRDGQKHTPTYELAGRSHGFDERAGVCRPPWVLYNLVEYIFNGQKGGEE